jgi:hypothetical protein
VQLLAVCGLRPAIAKRLPEEERLAGMALLRALFVGVAKRPANVIGVTISFGKTAVDVANHLISGGRAIFTDTHSWRDTYRIQDAKVLAIVRA